MAVSLVKGGNVSFAGMGLKVVRVGLGWDERESSGDDFDLDACCFMIGANGKVRRDADFIFYNHQSSSCGCVVHSGDNRTGDAEGDDETITVYLDKLSQEVERLVFTVTIHEATSRRQNFGMVSNAYIHVVDADKNEEVARFDLSEDASIDISMVFGELYRRDGVWKFKAVGQSYSDDLGGIARKFGVNV